MKKIILGILLILLVVPLYAFKIEPNLVVVHHLSLGDSAKPVEIKVLQLSDIQISESYATKRLDKVIAKVNRESPDVIVFTGDLFDNYAQYQLENTPFGATMITAAERLPFMSRSCKQLISTY